MKKFDLIETICNEKDNSNFDKISLEKRIIKIVKKLYSKSE